METVPNHPTRWVADKNPAYEQTIWRCANGYGASIVRHQHAYGGYELAVIRFEGEGPKWHITYDTPITNDDIGWLDDEKAEALLDAIAALPAPKAVDA